MDRQPVPSDDHSPARAHGNAKVLMRDRGTSRPSWCA
jgi:hypothetical protein